eukprot:TRINITY_DN1314_c0_g1_i1.p1 TRINITY_DN1314_c0_g1~~TRINITY_DN1314_c0_g1_i1.p1  ORF type:complete len:319 (-),score=36.86 TRINITY_DN1314_c0_g1_i1:408-1364(-)
MEEDIRTQIDRLIEYQTANDPSTPIPNSEVEKWIIVLGSQDQNVSNSGVHWADKLFQLNVFSVLFRILKTSRNEKVCTNILIPLTNYANNEFVVKEFSENRELFDKIVSFIRKGNDFAHALRFFVNFVVTKETQKLFISRRGLNAVFEMLATVDDLDIIKVAVLLSHNLVVSAKTSQYKLFANKHFYQSLSKVLRFSSDAADIGYVVVILSRLEQDEHNRSMMSAGIFNGIVCALKKVQYNSETNECEKSLLSFVAHLFRRNDFAESLILYGIVPVLLKSLQRSSDGAKLTALKAVANYAKNESLLTEKQPLVKSTKF